MTIEDHTSKTKTGSRANRHSPCDPETPVSIAPCSDCSFQKARSNKKSNVLACLGVRKNTTAAVVQHIPSVSLSSPGPGCNQRGKQLPCEETWDRRERTPTRTTYPQWNTLLPGSFKWAEPKWATTRAQLQRERQTTDTPPICRGTECKTRAATHAPWAALEREPIWITVSSLCRKDYCPRTPFRQEGKLNRSNSQEEWRHFLCWSRWCLEVIFSYMFSKLWKESITFKGPHFSISCSLQKWRNRVSLWEKSTKTLH